MSGMSVGGGQYLGLIDTSGIEMDVRLAEAVARRIAAWMDTAAQAQRNADFYRGLVDECAKHLGPRAFTADDGTVLPDPVLLRVPELVADTLHLMNDSSLLEDCVGRKSGGDRYRDAEALLADRTLPDLVTAGPLADKCASGGQQKGAKLAVEALPHQSAGVDVGGLDMLKAKSQAIYIESRQVFMRKLWGNSPDAIGQLLIAFRFCDQSKLITFRRPESFRVAHMNNQWRIDPVQPILDGVQGVHEGPSEVFVHLQNRVDVPATKRVDAKAGFSQIITLHVGKAAQGIQQVSCRVEVDHRADHASPEQGYFPVFPIPEHGQSRVDEHRRMGAQPFGKTFTDGRKEIVLGDEQIPVLQGKTNTQTAKAGFKEWVHGKSIAAGVETRLTSNSGSKHTHRVAAHQRPGMQARSIWRTAAPQRYFFVRRMASKFWAAVRAAFWPAGSKCPVLQTRTVSLLDWSRGRRFSLTTRLRPA